MKIKWTSLILAACVLGLASNADAQRPQRPQPGQLFKKFDTNKNGELEKTEVPAKLWARIEKFDKDQNDAVSKKELAAARQGKGKRKPGARIAQLFKRLDKDNDGKITAAEAGPAWARLSKLDTNNDQVVTKQEVAAAIKNRRKKV
jgi:Ca2+-binding EF-hand superfamily protein